MSRFQTRPTPNPNSLMLVRTDGGRFLESGLASFTTPAQAATSPLAAELFSLGTVAGVLVMPDFVTITRVPGADWKTLVPLVEPILDAHFPA